MGETEQETELRNLHIEVEALQRALDEAGEWGADLLTAWQDRGTARQYSRECKDANERFWYALTNPPAAVQARLSAEWAHSMRGM